MVVELLVTGQSPLGNPYQTWNRGEPPETIPTWESVFGSAELRRHPDIDQTGTYITYDQSVDGEQAIYMGLVAGSSARRLTRGYTDHNPVFSPNGQRIAFARDPDRIMVINLNGTELLEFGTERGSVAITDWSPSGDRVLFDADGDVFELDITTNATRLLASEPVDQWGAVYSPDGSRIYYISYEAAGRRPEIWSMGSDGSGHTQLTFNDLMERFVSVSPNGEKVAFTLEEEKLQGDRLCVMNPDGTDVRYFTDRSKSVFLLRWLPDGGGLLAEASTGDTSTHDLHTVNYPWSDAGLQSDDDDGRAGGGGGFWDGSGFFSFLLEPAPFLVLVSVVGIIGYSFHHTRKRERDRAEKAKRLKEVTGRMDDQPPLPPERPSSSYSYAPPSHDDYDHRWR